MKTVRALNNSDKVLIAAALLNAGVKARIKKLNIGYRVCFVGDQSAVIEALNNYGFLNAVGGQFDMHSFNQPHELFVRYAV